LFPIDAVIVRALS